MGSQVVESKMNLSVILARNAQVFSGRYPSFMMGRVSTDAIYRVHFVVGFLLGSPAAISRVQQ
jgi:hypothetical protein